jgi:hypothetical protein
LRLIPPGSARSQSLGYVTWGKTEIRVQERSEVGTREGPSVVVLFKILEAKLHASRDREETGQKV